MSIHSPALTLAGSLCAVFVLASLPGSQSYSGAQVPAGTWTFELNVRASDSSDGYIVFPDQPLTSLQLHTEKLTAYVQSIDGPEIRRSLTLDPSVAPPENYRSYVPWAGFRLDYDSLPPGMYTMSAGAEPGFATLIDGSRETLDVDGVRTLTVYVPQHPDRLSVPAIGERYILTFGRHNGQPTSVAGENGDPLPFEQVAARPLTYAGHGSSTLSGTGVTFTRADGDGHRIAFPGFGDPKDVPGLYPLVEDRVTREMNSKFGGRRVWTYGAAPTLCLRAIDISCDNAGPNDELEVVAVYRARGYAEDMAIGDPMSGNLEQQDAFRALDPLIVALRVRGDRGPHAHSKTIPEGPNAYATFSDDWDLERSYSLVSMERSHPEWPVETRNAILKRAPKLGMTRDMIAWIFGYPSVFGTIAQMNRLDSWVYTGPPTMDIPGNNRTFDFRNGHVEACTPKCEAP